MALPLVPPHCPCGHPMTNVVLVCYVVDVCCCTCCSVSCRHPTTNVVLVCYVVAVAVAVAVTALAAPSLAMPLSPPHDQRCACVLCCCCTFCAISGPFSRQNDSHNVETVAQTVALLKSENDLLIQKRMIRNKKVKTQQTRHALKAERRRRKVAQEQEEERLRLALEHEEDALLRQGMAFQRGAKKVCRFFQTYERRVVGLFFAKLYKGTRYVKDCSTKAMRKEGIEQGKYHQEVGRARRLRQLVREHRG